MWDEFQSNWDALAISNAIYSLAIHVLYIYIKCGITKAL